VEAFGNNSHLLAAIHILFTMNHEFSSRRNFLTLGGLAAASRAITLRADALPTPETEDVHQYVDFLEATGQTISPEKKFQPTHQDILGPFWAGGAPFRGKVTAPHAPGKLMIMRGRIWSHHTKKPLPNAVIDVWQANHQGVYDFQTSKRPDSRPSLPTARNYSGGKQPTKSDFQNRIRLVTDEEGYYEYETIKPAAYGVGDSTRPSHIHYMVQAAGHATVITQCYFKGDPHIAKDPWASKSPLIISLQKTRNEFGQYLTGQFDLVLGSSKA